MRLRVGAIALLVFAILLMSAGVYLASANRTDKPVATTATVIDVNSLPLADMLRSKDFVLINVHTPYQGEIEQTDAFIPYDRIAGNVQELPTDKSAKIVVYCRTGRMSQIAAQELTELGYTSVYNHVGGMEDWQESGAGVVVSRR